VRLDTDELAADVEFDPLDEVGVPDEDDEAESVEFIGYIEKPSDEQIEKPAQPELTPVEKIRKLLVQMAPRRKVLLGIIDFCRDPQSPSAVDEFTDNLQSINSSVFSPVTLRQLLEQAEALEYLEGVTDDDSPAADELDEDGYLVVTKRPEGTWVATAAGIEVLDSLNPQQDLLNLLEKDSVYREIYLRILNYCDEEPRTKKQIDAIVDDDPLVQSPRRYSGYFVDKLDVCDALDWNKAWSTTSVGRSVLEDETTTEK
jgi:hypothetical protein